MKKVSFMVALLAVIQILLGSRISQAQNLRLNQDRHDDRRTLEEALDAAGEDIGQELEELFEQLDATSQKIGEKFERWAEENSEELSAWSDKYGDQWEWFGERLSHTMESIADDQRGVWSQWAERYERDLQQWGNDLETDELTGENIGRFIDDNLEALSKMPLGKLVDQALEDGVGELRNAPWESLEELGVLAKDALQEPIEEFAELTIDGAKAKRAFDRSAREMGNALQRLGEDIERNIADSDLLDLVDEEQLRDSGLAEQAKNDPRIKRLQELLQNDELPELKRQAIEEMIDAFRSSAGSSRGLDRDNARRNIDVPRRDQILEKIEREKKRHAQALDDFNMDLQRSSQDSLESQRRESDIQWRIKDSRAPKRLDGKDLDSLPRSGKTDRLKFFRDGDGRQPRTQKQSAGRSLNRSQKRSSNGGSAQQVGDRSDDAGQEPDAILYLDKEDKKQRAIETLLRQVEELREEVETLKRDRS